VQINLKLTEPQETFAFCPEPHPAMVAGLGAGKTEAGIVRLLLKMFQNPGINTAYYLPTYDLIKLRAMPGMEETLSRIGISSTANRSDYMIHVHGFGSCIFRSYDRPERIVSYEVAHSIVDELDTLPREKAAYVWRKVSERNRQQCGEANTIGNVTTPDQGINGFTYQKWEKQKQPGYVTVKAPTASNPFLPAGYIQQIRDNYDPILADLYLMGEYVSLTQNKVYHFFNRHKHHTTRTIQPGDKLYIGLDFNIGGTCATVFVIENNNPIAVDEFVSHDTQDFVNNLAKRYKGHKLTIYPDASGKSERTNASLSDIAIIQQAGYTVDAANVNPPVRDRINAMNAIFSHDKMLINTDKCNNFVEALEMQGYDKHNEPEKFNIHPAIDDWNDSAGYFVHRKFPINRPLLTTGIRTAR
jgi:PBSX family phage terminase large subunit